MITAFMLDGVRQHGVIGLVAEYLDCIKARRDDHFYWITGALGGLCTT